jgi:hypothetical protein
VAKQQQSLTGFFTSAKSKLDNDDNSSGNNNKKYKIFCDLDGVLVDFDSGVKSLFNGKSPNELAPGLMWSRISSTPSFYANLPWTSDGKLLWRTLVNAAAASSSQSSSSLASLDVLTGVPRNLSSRAEKFAWCQRELLMTNDDEEDNNADKTAAAAAASLSVNHVDMAGKKNTHTTVSGQKKRHINKKDQNDNNNSTTTVINIITCWSKNKHYESKKNHILIDDRVSLREAWEGNGGIFVHHTSAVETIRVLRERGILS